MIQPESVERVDEISIYYGYAKELDLAIIAFFWVIAIISFAIPYASGLNTKSQEEINVLYIVLVIVHFICTLILSVYLIPLAERKRRRQLLSNAIGTPLIQEKTQLYYNNEFAPSITRLGANVMENSLFSREIATLMLIPTRWIVGVYMVVWLVLFASRQSNLDIMLWVTQFVFSGAVILRWIQLEFLRFRHDQIYENLYSHFLGGQKNTPKSVATILDAFASYEAAKASAGLVLSTKVFNKINQQLTQKWENIRSELKMYD